jgi:hypothetical protein
MELLFYIQPPEALSVDIGRPLLQFLCISPTFHIVWEAFDPS